MPTDYDALLEGDDEEQQTPTTYDRLFAQLDGAQESTLRVKAQQATDTTPARTKEILDLAAETGLPAEVVERNFDQVQKRAAASKVDFSEVRRSAPILSEWLTERENLKLTQPDVPALGLLERTLQVGRRTIGAFGAGAMGVSKGAWGLIQMGAEGAGLESLAEFAKLTGGDVGMMQLGLRGDQGEGGGLETDIYGGIESLGQSVSALPLLFVPGGQTVASASFAGALGLSTAGQSYADARAAGVDPGQAFVYAYGQGGVEVVTEMIPAKWLLGDLAKNAGFFRTLTHQLAGEIPGEQIATVFQDLNEWAVLHPDKPFQAYLDERPSAAASTLVATIVAVGGHTMAARAVDRAFGGDKPTTQRLLEDVGAAAAQAQVRTLAPDKLTEFVNRVTSGTEVSTVHLPAETFVQYWQSQGQDPTSIAEALTGSPTALVEALEQGSDLAVPMARYVTQIAGTEHNAFFSQEARVSPEDLNAREDAAFAATMGERPLGAELTPADRAAPAAAAVRDTVARQLVEAGVEASTAQAYAGLHQAAFATLGARAGLDPQAVFDRYQLAITRELETPAAPGAPAAAGGRAVSAIDIRRAVEQTRARRGQTTEQTPEQAAAAAGELTPEQVAGLASGELDPLDVLAAGRSALASGRPDLGRGVSPGGVPRSSPPAGEQPQARLARRQTHYSALTRAVLKAARAIDPLVPLTTVRDELAFRVEAFEERQQAFLESGKDPLDLLRAIADMGGINTTDKSFPGEVKWVKDGQKFGRVAGVPGVFKKDGLSLELVATDLSRGDQRFEWVTTDNLIDAIDDAVRHGVDEEVDRFPGSDDLKDDLGIDPTVAWWEASWRGAGEAAPAVALDEDLLGDAIALEEEGDISFDPAELEGTEELHQGPVPSTLEEILASFTGPTPELVEGEALPAEEGAPRPTVQPAPSAKQRLQALAPRPLALVPDAVAVPFESVEDSIGTTLFRARDVSTRYQQRLPVDRLIATQATISTGRVLQYLEEGALKLIDVLEHEGRYYIADGTHAAAAAWARGDKRITASITKVNPAWLEAPPPYRSALEPVPPDPLGPVAFAAPAPASGLETPGSALPVAGEAVAGLTVGSDIPNTGSIAASLTDYEVLEGVRTVTLAEAFPGYVPRFYSPQEEARTNALAEQIRASGTINPLIVVEDAQGFYVLEGGHRFDAVHLLGLEAVPALVVRDLESLETEELNQADLEDYAGQHRPPGPKDGAPAHDLTGAGRIYPEDVYSAQGLQFYGTGDKALDRQTFKILTALKGKPDAKVTIYRAVPADVDQTTINAGDWVSVNRKYVEDHGLRFAPEGGEGEAFKVLELEVEAGEIFTNGDSIHEWGYWPGGAELAQEDEPEAGGRKRGVIRIGPGRSMNIALFAGADLSTFLHESGHFFLEVFADTARALQALDPETLTAGQRSILADYGAGLQWLGVESFSDLTVAQKEQWARGFEAYLFEGKAPSVELRSSFARFRAWLVGIYRSLKGLRVQLNPEIRGVFDRLLATDAAIAATQREAALGPLFTTAESAGMSPAEWEAYQALVERSRTTAQEELQESLLADYRRAREQWWKEERARVREEVARQKGTEHVYVALSAIRTGLRPDGTPFVPGAPVTPFKLNKADLQRQFGPGITKKLPRPFLYTTEGGIHPDDAAELLGFGSGEALVNALEDSVPFEKAVDLETDRIMAARHGDTLAEGQLRELAREAVESSHQADLLEAEQRALARQRRAVAPFVEAAEAGAAAELEAERAEREYERRWLEAEAKLRIAIAEGRKQSEIDLLTREAEREKAAMRAGVSTIKASVPSVQALRSIAEARVNAALVGDLKPATFWAAAKRAGNQAIELAARNDYQGAAEAKGRQRINLELYRAAQAALDQVEEARTEAAKMFKADATLAKSRNMDFVAAARTIAAHYFFPQRREAALESLKRVQQYDPDLYDNLEAQIGAALAQAPEIKALTFEAFVGVRDTIGALWTLSRRAQQVQIEGKLLEREAVLGELAGRLQVVGLPTERPGYSQAATKWERAQMYLLGARAALRRVEHWVDAVDGGNLAGVFRRYVWQPISDAAAAYRIAKRDVVERYLELVKGIEGSLVPGKIAAPEIGYTFANRAELLHAILHTGNASNLQKLLRGRKWGSYLEDGTLDTSKWDRLVGRLQREGVLTAADYTFAQGVWDLFEAQKPAAQKAHREMYGLYFSELTAQAVVTPFGTFRGGYVPAIADPFLAPDASVRAEKAQLTEGQNSFMFPTTGRGFTRARVEAYAKPLALDLRLIPQHLDKVLRFVHLEPVVKDVGRMVFDPSFRQTLDAFDPTVASDLLVPWLQRAASQKVQTASQGWGGRAADTFFRGVRTRTGLNIMTANVVNTLQQFTGFSVGMTQVSPRYFLPALWRFVRGPRELADAVAEASPWMRTRVSTQVLEVQNTIDDLLLNPSKYDQARQFAARHGYFAQQMTQNVVDLITWSAGYDEATAQGKPELEAVRAADAAVRLTQGSFAPEDVSRFETGSPFMRAFSMFFSYFNNQANLLGSKFSTIIKSDVGLRKGAGRALYLYTFGFMIPAVLSEVIRQSVGGWDADDDDSYLDEVLAVFFGSQARAATAFVPVLGPTLQASINAFNARGWDDRISTSPAVSALEQSVRSPASVYDAIVEGRGYKKAIRDTLTAIGLMTGLPLAPLGKPLGYAADVAEGRADPETALELAQGLVTGRTPR